MKELKYTRVKDLSQYTTYCNKHEELIIKEDERYEEEIELLELLIEDYDSRITDQKIERLNPVELLRSLLETNEMSQIEFSREIKISKQLLSDILGYRRNISKELVLKFSEYFSVSQEAFSRKYDLKPKKKEETTGDNLQLIEGIGPKLEKILNSNEINTYEDLYKKSSKELNSMIVEAGVRYLKYFDEKLWKSQSKRLSLEKKKLYQKGMN